MTERSRPTEARVAPLTDIGGEAVEVMATTINREDGTPLNIFATLAHHPKLFKRFNLFGGFLLNKGLVPAREREIVILRVGWNARSVYEFGQHTAIGRRVGMSDAEIEALARSDVGDSWAEHELDLIAMADELCADDCVSDATFDRLRRRWSEAELIELVVCAGFYRLVSGFLNTMGVQPEPDAPTVTFLD